MPKLIKRGENGAFGWAENPFVTVGDEDALPQADVIVPLKRFLAEGEGAQPSNHAVGVLVQPGETIEDLAYDLPRVAVVALAFPKFSDGRALSAARLLRERYGFKGEIRAVGEVLREAALHMVRCGFDAFEASDGSTPEEWEAAAIKRYRHVYQRAADERPPAFVERGTGS